MTSLSHPTSLRPSSEPSRPAHAASAETRHAPRARGATLEEVAPRRDQLHGRRAYLGGLIRRKLGRDR